MIMVSGRRRRRTTMLAPARVREPLPLSPLVVITLYTTPHPTYRYIHTYTYICTYIVFYSIGFLFSSVQYIILSITLAAVRMPFVPKRSYTDVRDCWHRNTIDLLHNCNILPGVAALICLSKEFYPSQCYNTFIIHTF